MASYRYSLFLGNRTYSSWSLRGWLLFEKFGIPISTTTFVDFNLDQSVSEQMGDAVNISKTVPTLLILPESTEISDSLAMAEELATRHPDAGIWPSGNPQARAIARTLAAEMHSSFNDLRNDCPMNLRVAYEEVPTSKRLLKDVKRVEALWEYARSKLGASDQPWLCGEYSAVDAFYAPVAARIAGYGLQVSPSAQAYVDAHLSDLAFRRWRAMAIADRSDNLPRYVRDYPQTKWPGPDIIAAKAVPAGPSENAQCPYSGKSTEFFFELDGRVFGTCNEFCRDKTVADPEAWPDFMAIV